MVDTDILEVYVEPNSLVEVHRCEDAIVVRRFDCKANYAPSFFPLKLSHRRRITDWVVPAAFVVGFFFSVWLVFVR